MDIARIRGRRTPFFLGKRFYGSRVLHIISFSRSDSRTLYARGDVRTVRDITFDEEIFDKKKKYS